MLTWTCYHLSLKVLDLVLQCHDLDMHLVERLVI